MFFDYIENIGENTGIFYQYNRLEKTEALTTRRQDHDPNACVN
jgi:hypothetical protein